MGIYRHHKQNRYTSLDNELLQRADLTWEARGLLAYILSLPPDWQIKTEHLINQSPAGRDKTLRVLGEIEEAGYIYRQRKNGEGGRLEWICEVFETIEDKERWLERLQRSPSTITGFSGHGESTITGFAVDGLAVDGLAVDGLAVDGLAVDGLAVDGLLYLQNKDLQNKDLQTKERQSDRANFEPFSSTPVLEQDSSSNPVQVSSVLDQTQTQGDRKVPPPPAAIVSPLPPKNACERSDQAFRGMARQDPNYARFKSIYGLLANVVDGRFGNNTDAEWAWDKIHEGARPVNDAFWQGLEAFRMQAIAQFKTEGRVIGFKGAKNWLLDRGWETALERQAILQQGLDSGIDLTNPRNVKAAGVKASNDAAFEAMKKFRAERTAC